MADSLNSSSNYSGYSISRPILHTSDLQNGATVPEDEAKTSKTYIFKKYLSRISFLSIIHNLIPITYWLPRYDIKSDLLGDLMSGFTVFVMHIPQGMSYGILALVTPEVGLYMAFFPVLIYFLLGTSRHASLGTFAVISIMVSKTVQTHSSPGIEGSPTLPLNGTDPVPLHTPMEVVTTLSLMVGLIQLAMFVCRMGALATLLSEPLVSGFTTGAAVHVFVNQLKDILGIPVSRHRGALKIIYSLIELFSRLDETNKAALLISLVLIVTMVLNNECLKPRVAKLCRFPIPIELIAVIGGTLLSRFVDLGVNLVGPIPTGLPNPKWPKFSLLGDVAMDALAIAIVSYSVLMSMAKTFAKKHGYEVRPNQELLANGLANLVGSVFSCMPTGCALARSVIQEQTGGKTQIASLVSANLILLVILFIGPVFEVLPRCVLSSIIVVALKTMLWQVFNLGRFYRQDRLEALTWIVTFLSVVVIDIDLGLLLGLIMSLVSWYFRGLRSHSSLLGVVPGTDVYVDLSHKFVEKVEGVEIFKYSGSLNFATAPGMKRQLYEAIDIQVIKVDNETSKEKEKLSGNKVKTVIFDLNCVPRVDFAAGKTLLGISMELNAMGVDFLIAGANGKVHNVLKHVFLMEKQQIDLLVTVHDAVLLHKTKLEA